MDAYTALKVVSEIGTDMSKWPSAGHFASWLGLSPNNRVSGGRILSSRTRRNTNRAAAALRLAAGALHHSDSALGAFYRRKRLRKEYRQRAWAAQRRAAQLGYDLIPVSGGSAGQSTTTSGQFELVGSALDRLANASYQIVIEGASYRERLSPHRALQGVQGGD